MPMSINGVSAAAGVTGGVLWSGMPARILLNGGEVQPRAASNRAFPGCRGLPRAIPAGGARGVRGALAIASTCARADQVAWRDIESRIQYGYYTEDSGALRKLEELVAAGDAHDKLRGYYGGLLAFRRAQLAAPGGAAAQGGTPAQYAQRCVSELDSSLALEAEFAEALALRAACLAEPLEISGGYGPLSG